MQGEKMKLISQLIQGKDMAEQLRNHLHLPCHEKNRTLIEGILGIYDKSLSMLSCSDLTDDHVGELTGEAKTVLGCLITSLNKDSPCSLSNNNSPTSEVLHHPHAFKKRKTIPKRTEKVKVLSGVGLEGPLDDGHSWRKYGQKDILGAAHPRGYYRCTHRNVRGCLATKQVQRSDEDPTIFEITYKGSHTCKQASHRTNYKPCPSTSSMERALKETQIQNHHELLPQHVGKPELVQEAARNLGGGLKVETEEESIFTSFCFTSPSLGSEIEEKDIFGEALMENNFMTRFETEFMRTETATTSGESNLFPFSSCFVDSFGPGHNGQTPESDMTDHMASAPTSVTNSPILDLVVSLDQVDFDANYPFDNPEFFS